MFHYPEDKLSALAIISFILGCIAGTVFFVLAITEKNAWYLLSTVICLFGSWVIGVLFRALSSIVTSAMNAARSAYQTASELESLNKKVDIISKKIN